MNLRLLASSLGLVIASQLYAGCIFPFPLDDHDDPIPLVPPQEEVTSFRFTASRGCDPFSDACSSDRLLLAGVREQMLVSLSNNWSGADPTVTSSDPSVIDVGPVRRNYADNGRYVGTFDVRAGDHAGSAAVTVTQGDGRTSTVILNVDEAAGMDIVEDEGTSHYDRSQGHISLRVGERISINGEPVNRNAVRLLSNDGVVWTVPDTRQVNLSWSYMAGPRVADDHVYVEAVAPGTEVLTVRAGVVERTLIIDVR